MSFRMRMLLAKEMRENWELIVQFENTPYTWGPQFRHDIGPFNEFSANCVLCVCANCLHFLVKVSAFVNWGIIYEIIRMEKRLGQKHTTALQIYSYLLM